MNKTRADPCPGTYIPKENENTKQSNHQTQKTQWHDVRISSQRWQEGFVEPFKTPFTII